MLITSCLHEAFFMHLIISVLSSTIKSFMAGGVCLLILNKKSIEQTMNDYIITCKMISMLRKGIKLSSKRCIFAKLFLM